MSAIALPSSRPVLADALVARRGLAVDTALVAAGALIVALCAQVEIPLPLVPITGQTLGVILVGAALGSRRGAAAMVAYLVAGLAGLPVFAGFSGSLAAIALPSFGFILGFIPAAFLTGWFAERHWDRTPIRAMVGFVLASAIPFLVGVPYMAAIMATVLHLPIDLPTVLSAGLWPFIPGGLVKAALAAVLIPLAWRLVRRIEN